MKTVTDYFVQAFIPCNGCIDYKKGYVCVFCHHQTLVAMTDIAVDMILRGEY